MKFLRLCVKENAGEKKKVIFLTGRKKNLNEKIEKRQNVQHIWKQVLMLPKIQEKYR